MEDQGNTSDGRSPATKAWIARRDAVRQAEEAVAKRLAEDRAPTPAVKERADAGSMLVFFGATLLILGILVALGWYFLDAVECDPMITARGLGVLCKR